MKIVELQADQFKTFENNFPYRNFYQTEEYGMLMNRHQFNDYYLGLDNNKFPFEISEKDHQNSYKLIDNILVKGNFGHNTNYVQPHGVIHGLQQFWQVLKQCSRFGKYAPSESWGYLLVKVRWWFKKLKRVTCITAWINRKS